MNYAITQYKRVQAMKVRAPQQVNVNRRREDNYQPPAPLWLQWAVMIAFSLLMTYAFFKAGEFVASVAGGAL